MLSEALTHLSYLRSDVDSIKTKQDAMQKDIEQIKINDAKQDTVIKTSAGKTGALVSTIVSGIIAGMGMIVGKQP